MSDGRELEENENSLALATDCAKLWPKMLSKGLQDEYPPQGLLMVGRNPAVANQLSH